MKMNSLGSMMNCELFFSKKDFPFPVFLLTLTGNTDICTFDSYS